MKEKRVLAIMMVMVTILACSTMVFAESYNSTLSVTTQWDGSSRSFSSGSTLYCNCFNTYLDTPFAQQHSSDMLYIQALKNDFAWIIYHKVGSEVGTTVYSNGYTSVYSSFPMDGSGSYKFRFTKRDASWGAQEAIKSNNVQMTSA